MRRRVGDDGLQAGERQGVAFGVWQEVERVGVGVVGSQCGSDSGRAASAGAPTALPFARGALSGTIASDVQRTSSARPRVPSWGVPCLRTAIWPISTKRSAPRWVSAWPRAWARGRSARIATLCRYPASGSIAAIASSSRATGFTNTVRFRQEVWNSGVCCTTTVHSVPPPGGASRQAVPMTCSTFAISRTRVISVPSSSVIVPGGSSRAHSARARASAVRQVVGGGGARRVLHVHGVRGGAGALLPHHDVARDAPRRRIQPRPRQRVRRDHARSYTWARTR